MTFRVEKPAKDRLLDAELLLDESARAADLVADDLLPAIFAEPGSRATPA